VQVVNELVAVRPVINGATVVVVKEYDDNGLSVINSTVKFC
jgi:hypothetical protein